VQYSKVAQISIAGLVAQKARLEAAALNISNMNTSIAPGTAGFRPMKAVIHLAPAAFSSAWQHGAAPLMVAKAELVPQSGPTTRSVYEPGNPDADAAGMVLYPAVDHTQEMMTVMSALRAYEANLAVLESSKAMAAKALEIGGQ
jgi:flagellar basal-body rod protein FlgC